MTLGEQIRAAREGKSLSQEELAQAGTSSKKRNAFVWIGWGLAAVLLIFIVATWIYQKEPVQEWNRLRRKPHKPENFS